MKSLWIVLALLALVSCDLDDCGDDDDTGDDDDDDDNDDDNDTGDDDDTGDGSLAWALSVADDVVDEEFNGGVLDEVLGFVDDNGRITDTEPTDSRTFYYYRGEQGADGTWAVDVFLDGSTFSWEPGGAIVFAEVPHYSSAAEWVAAADEQIDDLEFYYRSVQVFHDEEDLYDAVENIAIVYYDDETYDNIAWVDIDADTNDVLDVNYNK